MPEKKRLDGMDNTILLAIWRYRQPITTSILRDIMTDPNTALHKIRQHYQRTRDANAAHNTRTDYYFIKNRIQPLSKKELIKTQERKKTGEPRTTYTITEKGTNYLYERGLAK